MGSNYDIATIPDSGVNDAVHAKMQQLNTGVAYIGLVYDAGQLVDRTCFDLEEMSMIQRKTVVYKDPILITLPISVDQVVYDSRKVTFLKNLFECNTTNIVLLHLWQLCQTTY